MAGPFPASRNPRPWVPGSQCLFPQCVLNQKPRKTFSGEKPGKYEKHEHKESSSQCSGVEGDGTSLLKGLKGYFTEGGCELCLTGSEGAKEGNERNGGIRDLGQIRRDAVKRGNVGSCSKEIVSWGWSCRKESC